jgi:Fe-S-cluster containining protein
MADEVSRQQRRRIEREQVKAGRTLVLRGLAAEPRRAQMIAVAHVLKAKLAERDNTRRAGEAADIAQELAENSLAAYPGRAAIACRRGCKYCCHTFVAAVPPEVFRIARAVREGSAGGLDAAALSARSAPLRGLGPEQRIGARLACPLLIDGMCSVYDERPLVCRQATALSVEACTEEYEGRSGGSDRIEVSAAHLAHASNAHVALLGAMLAVRLPVDAFELSSALVVALADAESERRWLAGEDVFRELPRNVRRPAGIDMVARKIAEIIGS